MPHESQVNWLLKNRVEDGTRATHGWSYRTETIQIALLQEIRDELKIQTALLQHRGRGPRGWWRKVVGSV